MNAAKRNDDLFEESSQGAASATTAILFVLAMVLFLAGSLGCAYAFAFDGVTAALVFTVSMLAIVASFMIAFVRPSQAGKID